MMMSREELSKLPVSTKQHRIATIARQKMDEPLTLLHHYMDVPWLESAFLRLKTDSAPGIDAQKVEEYSNGLEMKLEKLLDQAKSGIYKAPPVKRVEIPKPGSKETRPIGIPTTEDKVLQKAVQMLLDPVYEQEFYEFSFGFRKGKSQHQALDYLWNQIMNNRIHWIIDLDILKFFDTVKHDIIQKLLGKRVRDRVIIRLIGKWLNAGIMKDGSLSYPIEGTPQGGVISPLISNIYLHETLDKWYMNIIRPQLQKQSFMIRFADDAIMGFESKEEAESVLKTLKGRLMKYGLELHAEKTHLLYFGRPSYRKEDADQPEPKTFDFLGFTHYWGKSRQGNWIVKRKTSEKKFREKCKKIAEWCKKNRHQPVREQHKSLCQKLKGHYGYYGITGNAPLLDLFRYEVRRIWRKWLDRRGNKRRLNWEQFAEHVETKYPLPPIKVTHSIYRVKNHKTRNRMR